MTKAIAYPGRRKRLLAPLGVGALVLFLLYPFAGLWAHVGTWRWGGDIPGSTAAAVRVSLGLTALAMLIVLAAGTPAAWWAARRAQRSRWIFDAAVLASVLLPPLALGLLLSLSLGPGLPMGRVLLRLGVPVSNNAFAFVLTQVYCSLGYYLLAARAAFTGASRELELTAAALGLSPWAVFWRVTFPLTRTGLAAALSLAWVRALGEFGAIIVTAYYPSGMPVQIWVNLQDAGLPAVMPLLLIFLLAALPLPWLVHMLARRSDA